jgi:hypothetical protein
MSSTVIFFNHAFNFKMQHRTLASPQYIHMKFWLELDNCLSVAQLVRAIDILYTLDSASNYSTIQKLKPWLQTQDIPMKWEDSYVFYFLNYSKYIFKLFKWWKLLLFFKPLLASGKHQHGRHLFKWG